MRLAQGNGNMEKLSRYSTAVVHHAQANRPQVYTFGGSAGSSRKNDLWTHQNGVWAEIEPRGGAAPTPRNSHSAVVWGNTIVIFGGWDGCRNCNDLYLFDIPTSQWRPVAPGGVPPKCRRGHSAVVAGQAMFVFGGWDGGRNFADFYKLSLGGAGEVQHASQLPRGSTTCSAQALCKHDMRCAHGFQEAFVVLCLPLRTQIH